MLHSPEPLKLTITEKAAEKVKAAIEKKGKSDAALRLYVAGGGCSGFQYSLAFDKQNGDDHVIEAQESRSWSTIKAPSTLMAPRSTVWNPSWAKD